MQQPPRHLIVPVSADKTTVVHIVLQYSSAPAMLRPEQPVDHVGSASLAATESSSFLVLCEEVRGQMVKARGAQA